MHRVLGRHWVASLALLLAAGTPTHLDACGAVGEKTQNPPPEPGFVSGGLAVSLSERALTDALQRHVLPELRDSLAAALADLPGSSVESLLRAAGTPGPIPDTHGATFDKVRWDPSALQLQVELVEPDTLRLEIQSGPVAFVMSAQTCHGNCLIGCCLRSRAGFEIRMQDVLVNVDLTPKELLHGAASEGRGRTAIGHPRVEIRGLEVDFGSPHVGGVVGWLSGAAIAAEVFNLFGVPRALLGAFAGDTIVASIEEPLEDAILEQFPEMEFEGLESLGLAPDLPATAPVRLDTRFADVPEIQGGEAILVQLGTAFAPHDSSIERAAYWPAEAARVLNALTATGGMAPEHEAPELDAVTLGADVAIATSQDAVNQLLAALASSGATRARFDGLRVGELVPGVTLPLLGISADTPVSIAIDAARMENGHRLAPHIEFVDDEATPDVLEAKVRLRMTVRGILTRGQTVTNDSTLRSCLGRDPRSTEAPCVLSEGDVDLDLLVGAHLEAVAESLALVRVAVTEVRELAVVEPMSLAVAADSSVADSLHAAMGLGLADSLRAAGDLEVVDSSETSPILALVRDRLNALSVPIPVPLDVLTLGGWMDVTNLRLFTTADDSTRSGSGYLGILADLDVGDAVPALVAQRPVVVPVAAPPAAVAPPVSEARLAHSVPGATMPPVVVPPPVAARPERYTRWSDPQPTLTATIRAGMPSASSWTLTIYDAHGRPVRRLRGKGGPGYVDIAWDGRAEDGRAVAGGDYVYHFESQGYEVSRRLQLGE